MTPTLLPLLCADAPSDLELLCSADPEWSDVEAAAGAEKVPAFKILAYTGGAMRVPNFFRPVVVDLSGIRASAAKLPLLRNHDPDRIVGHAEVTISAADIRAEGIVSADNEHSRDVLASAKKGFPWQISIGATPLEFEQVGQGQKVTVNGKTVAGPVLVARKTSLNELSFVPLGADSKTSAKLAAHAATLADIHTLRGAGVRPATLAELHARRKR